MADLKISALTAATTPLGGTEVLPIVQSSTTVKVAVSNLTSGRAVGATSFDTETAAAKVTLSGTSLVASGTDASINIDVTPKGTAGVRVKNARSKSILESTTGTNDVTLNLTNTGGSLVIGKEDSVGSEFGLAAYSSAAYGGSGYDFHLGSNGRVSCLKIGNPDVTVTAGNLVQGTAAKGVNFTANTPAAGMTSQLLNWYEEGTWTPNQGSGLTVVGAFTSSGTYTRVGRLVTVTGKLTGATSIACTAVGLLSSNLPFTSAATVISTGGLINASVTSSGITWVNPTSTEVYSASAVTATGSIYFSVGYHI
jgi:hypothetical protein